MTPKIMLDRLRSDWVDRRSSELVIATNQNTEEEDKAQRASGSCNALTGALHDLNHLPDRETPSLGTFEILEQLIVSRMDEAEEDKLNLTPGDQGFKLMEKIGAIEEFCLILQDIHSKQAALTAKDARQKPTWAKRQTLTTPVEVLAVAFVPDMKLGPDTGRKYALVKVNECFYPLIFINQDMDGPEHPHLNGRPVSLLKPNEIPGATEEVNENGYAYWKEKKIALGSFLEHYTRNVFGYLVDEW